MPWRRCSSRRVGEEPRDLAAGVLVDAMLAHERIEDEQARPVPGDRLGEASAIGLDVEADGGCGDDVDVEIGEGEAGSQMPSRRRRTIVQRVLGGIEEDTTGAQHTEAAQAWCARCDGYRDVESEERLAALGS